MICRNCNSQVPEDAAFCPECGANLAEANKNGNKNGNEDGNKSENRDGKQKLYLIMSIACVVVLGGAIIGHSFMKKDPKPDTAQLFDADEREAEAEPKAAAVESKDTAVESEDTAEAAADDKPDTGDVKQVKDETEVVEEPVYDETEGGIHRYEFVIQDCGWNQAYRDSLLRGGYLVRINSREEYDYILKEISNRGYDKIHFYLGGRKADNEGGYYWIDENNKTYGEKLNGNEEVWCNGEWMAGEPSYEDPGLHIAESYLNIFYYSGEGRWVWNDGPEDIPASVPEFSQKVGYIVEYEQ